MSRAKLTPISVRNLKPAASRYDTWDMTLPGFGLRTMPTGAKSWIVAIRKPGAKHPSRIKIGEPSSMTLAEARAAAREMMADPGGERKETGGDTVAEVLAAYIEMDQKPYRKSWAEVERVLQKDLAPLADQPAAGIERRDIVAMVNAIAARGAPVMARRTLAHVRRMFNWAVEQEILEANPAAAVKPPTRAPERDRVLTLEELRAVWRAAEALGWPTSPVISLMALTAQRKGEVAGLRWAEIDVRAREWILPSERTKNERRHVVPLSDPALAIITGLPRLHDELAFPTRAGRPIRVLPKQKLDELSGVQNWRPHDVRRSVATELGRLGYSADTIGALLNHRPSSVTNIYARWGFEPEKRRALEAWAECFNP